MARQAADQAVAAAELLAVAEQDGRDHRDQQHHPEHARAEARGEEREGDPAADHDGDVQRPQPLHALAAVGDLDGVGGEAEGAGGGGEPVGGALVGALDEPEGAVLERRRHGQRVLGEARLARDGGDERLLGRAAAGRGHAEGAADAVGEVGAPARELVLDGGGRAHAGAAAALAAGHVLGALADEHGVAALGEVAGAGRERGRGGGRLRLGAPALERVDDLGGALGPGVGLGVEQALDGGGEIGRAVGPQLADGREHAVELALERGHRLGGVERGAPGTARYSAAPRP
ncbi:MAG: hypothetical protein R3F59_11210 [Myxococcota bacterium]